MIPKEDQDKRWAVGVDVGATLAKIAAREPGGGFEFGFLPASALEAVARRIEALEPASVGLTGCGASQLESQLSCPGQRFVEFAAWGAGAGRLLCRQGAVAGALEPYLLVSLGTGTSVLRVEAEQAARVGGTALGGGTVLGLGVALTGCESYQDLCRLAEAGQRGNVDLLVSDIYRPGEIPLPGETTAASFGSLARWLVQEGVRDSTASDDEPPRREDLAAAVMGLVGENVALVCCGLARTADVSRIVYGGATLLGNHALVAILKGVTASLGLRPELLPDGGFAGAVGALELAVECHAGPC